jgi:ubiquinone/menaquinone biosynthesis C-methylase UbiE
MRGANNDETHMTDARLSTIRDFEYAGWETAASHYEQLFAGATKPYVDPLLEAVRASPGVRLLDVACGPGIATSRARAAGAIATGVDFSPAMIGVARSSHPDIDFIEADATALPFDDDAFDAVISNFGVHHFEDPERSLRQFERVAKPLGRVAFTLWAAPQENPAWRVMIEAVRAFGTLEVPMPAGNDSRNNVEDFAELTRRAGFSDVRTRPVEKPWRMPGDTDLVTLFEKSTVRMGSLLKGQTSEALAAIRRRVAEVIAAHSADGVTLLQTKAHIVSASKSSV